MFSVLQLWGQGPVSGSSARREPGRDPTTSLSSLPPLVDILPFSNLKTREPTGVVHPSQPPGEDSRLDNSRK